MPRFAQVDEHGLIYGVVTVLRGDYDGLDIGAAAVVVGRTALIDGQLVDVGAPPSVDHVFRAGGWLLDSARVEQRVRTTRARLLAASDWTQLPDAPAASKTAWTAYRQALRDITDQPGFPENALWPTAPDQ